MTDTQRTKWEEEIRKPYVTNAAQSLFMAASKLVHTVRDLVARDEVLIVGPFEDSFFAVLQVAEGKNATPSTFLAAYQAYGEAQRTAVESSI